MPMNNCYLTAAYKHPDYKKHWGFTHYGYDLGSENKTEPILAQGSGRVIKTGYDNACGNVAVIEYPAVTLKNGKENNLICRLCHMSKIRVTEGQAVKVGDIIGNMGNTGEYTSGPHLHIEFDTDTAYPCYTPTVKGSNILKGGRADTVVNPKEVLTLGKGQSVFVGKNAYGSKSDLDFALHIFNTRPENCDFISVAQLLAQGVKGVAFDGEKL